MSKQRNISLMQSLASGSEKHFVEQMDSICREANKEAELSLVTAARTLGRAALPRTQHRLRFLSLLLVPSA